MGTDLRDAQWQSIQPPLPARPTSSGTSTQPESLEGGTQPRVVRQLAKIGNRYGFLAIA
jgi:hypothetical protein